MHLNLEIEYFFKVYRFVSFAVKNMSTNIGKNLSGKYSLGMLASSQKFLETSETIRNRCT